MEQSQSNTETTLFDPAMDWAGKKVRAFAKRWLDVLRNIVVIAAILVLADKSENLSLKIIGYFSFCVMTLYLLTYTPWWHIDPLIKINNKNIFIRLGVNALLNTIAIILFWITFYLIYTSINAIIYVNTNV